jgi:hypothetical protein
LRATAREPTAQKAARQRLDIVPRSNCEAAEKIGDKKRTKQCSMGILFGERRGKSAETMAALAEKGRSRSDDQNCERRLQSLGAMDCWESSQGRALWGGSWSSKAIGA